MVDTIKQPADSVFDVLIFLLLQRWQGLKMFYYLYCILLLSKLIDPTVYTPDRYHVETV